MSLSASQQTMACGYCSPSAYSALFKRCHFFRNTATSIGGALLIQHSRDTPRSFSFEGCDGKSSDGKKQWGRCSGMPICAKQYPYHIIRYSSRFYRDWNYTARAVILESSFELNCAGGHPDSSSAGGAMAVQNGLTQVLSSAFVDNQALKHTNTHTRVTHTCPLTTRALC